MKAEKKHYKIIGILIGVSFLLLLALTVFLHRTRKAAPEYVLTYAENQTESYPTTLGAKYFAELVEERTEGRIRILVKAEGVMGSEREVIRQMQYGGIDFARVSLATISEEVPELNALQMPYLYKDSAHMWKILDGELGERFLQYSESGDLVGLSWYDAGARSFYCKDRPIRCLEDMKGLHIRVQESELMADVIRALGAVSVKIPYDQVYSALERGEVEAAENNWSSYETMQHYEVAPYYTVDEHIRIPEMQICAKHTWEQLSMEDQETIRQCARRSALYERELWEEYTEAARKKVLENGAVEIQLSESEKKRFREAMEGVYEKYCGEQRALIDEILAKDK